MQAKNKKEIL